MVQPVPPQQNKPKAKGPAPIVAQDSRFMEYVKVNAIFWGFLLLLCVAVYIDCAISGVIKFGDPADEVMMQVFYFILGVFGGGFTAVSIFDALYDKFAGPEEIEPAR